MLQRSVSGAGGGVRVAHSGARVRQQREREHRGRRIVKVLIEYHGRGPGGIYGFDPNAAARALLRELFPDAQWFGGIMYVEHRYVYGAAEALEERGVELLRASDHAPIKVSRGEFVMREVAS
jgi:hypothetical protein